jgi:hypothetical protein
MVAATLVDIIRRFKVNKATAPDSKEELYADFPEKVTVFSGDTLLLYWGHSWDVARDLHLGDFRF